MPKYYKDAQGNRVLIPEGTGIGIDDDSNTNGGAGGGGSNVVVAAPVGHSVLYVVNGGSGMKTSEDVMASDLMSQIEGHVLADTTVFHNNASFRLEYYDAEGEEVLAATRLGTCFLTIMRLAGADGSTSGAGNRVDLQVHRSALGGPFTLGDLTQAAAAGYTITPAAKGFDIAFDSPGIYSFRFGAEWVHVAPVVDENDTPVPAAGMIQGGHSVATAIPISGTGSIVGSNRNHPDSTDYSPYGYGGTATGGSSHTRGVWLRYDCTVSGTATVDTAGTTAVGNTNAAATVEDPLARNDTYMRVYPMPADESTPLSPSVAVDDDSAGGGNSRVTWQAEAGQTYLICATLYYIHSYTEDYHINWVLP